VEERPPGKIDRGKETLWDQQSLENQRNEIEEDSLAIDEGSAEGISQPDAPFQ
jgi:hypothetical protein